MHNIIEFKNTTFASVLKFQDGFSIVRPLDQNALLREIREMDLGEAQNKYNKFFEERDYVYYSLRTPKNLPCAGITISTSGNCIVDIAKPLSHVSDLDYLSYLASLCNCFNLDITFYARRKDYSSLDIDIAEYNLHRKHASLSYLDKTAPIKLSDNMCIKSLLISNIKCMKNFPKNLTIEGNLYLFGTDFPAEAPKGLVVKGKIITTTDDFEDVQSFIQKYYV